MLTRLINCSDWLLKAELDVQSAVCSHLPLSAGVTEDTVCVGLARLGSDDQAIRVGTLRQLVSCDLGGPLHSLVVTGRLHPLEVDMLRLNAQPDALQHLSMIDSSTYTS